MNSKNRKHSDLASSVTESCKRLHCSLTKDQCAVVEAILLRVQQMWGEPPIYRGSELVFPSLLVAIAILCFNSGAAAALLTDIVPVADIIELVM